MIHGILKSKIILKELPKTVAVNEAFVEVVL
jgi:hypothetical protein